MELFLGDRLPHQLPVELSLLVRSLRLALLARSLKLQNIDELLVAPFHPFSASWRGFAVAQSALIS
jgi:hypothetical protein